MRSGGALRGLCGAAASALALALTACALPPPPQAAAPAPSVAPAPAVPAAAVPAPPPAPVAVAPSSPAPAPAPGPGPQEGVLLGQGLASWYGPGLHGRPTANGERFDRYGFTAAHRTLPFGTRVCVRSLVTGKTVLVRINDRGPFSGSERVIDLSQGAAQELGMIGLGIKPVELWRVGEGDTGCAAAQAWSDADPTPAVSQAARPARATKAGAPRKRGQ